VNTAWARLLLMCAAYAAGTTVAYAVGAYEIATIVGVILGAAAYVLTQDLGRPSGRGGSGRYWRGRRADDDKRRWN
jgi:hypothetical protein